MLFQYYTAIVFAIIFSMGIMYATVLADKVLPSRNKRGFLISFFFIAVMAITEWFTFYIEYNGIESRFSMITANIIVLSVAPAIPFVLASSIIELKYLKQYRIMLVINFILQCLSAKFEFIYYVDMDGLYYRGDFYWIYIVVYLITTIQLFISAYRLSKQYQNKSNYILLLIGILLISGIAIQMIDSKIPVVWLTCTLAGILMYIYFYGLVNQMDALTTLLNRRCYENQLRNLRNDVVIILFDVNKFKQINDNFGHPYGDHCLRILGKKIKRVYGTHGTCYRIGGDEFCVILERDLSRLEELNSKLKEFIANKQIKDSNLPSVSIGYGYYTTENPNFIKAVDDADEMMYREKNKL